MTDNRFYIKHERIIKDNHKPITENGYVFSYKSDAEEVCNLLNNQNAETKIKELSEENERLKSENKEYIKGLDLIKATSQSWASDVRELREENYRLENENEQLKKEKQYFLKVIFAMGNYAELDDYENIINARDAVKRRFLND